MRNNTILLWLVALWLATPLWAQTSTEVVNYKNCPTDTVDGEIVYKYEVEKSIGLYRVGVNFNVQQSEIIRMNPQLKQRGLHYGETILIPTGRRAVKETETVVVKTEVRDLTPAPTPVPVPTPTPEPTPAPEEVKETPVTEVAETPKETVVVAVPEAPVVITSDTIAIAADTVILVDTLPQTKKQVVELALMLPFESQQIKRSQNADKMLEFYQGALLALYELQNDSTLFRLRVYDTERSERRVNALCDSSELDSVRGILGLVYPIQIERMTAWSAAHNIPLLVPFSNDLELAEHSQLMQFNATDRQEADSLCRWMQGRDLHCVAIEVREADMTTPIRTLRKQMRASGIAYHALALRDLMADSATYALDKEKENLVILHSDRYQHVRALLPHIEALQAAGYRIRLLSQFSWQKENIHLPQVYTSMFTAHGASEAYEALWKQYFINGHVSESPRYDRLGYDLMKTLIARLNGETSYHGLQSDIEFVRISENGGWQNSHVQVVSTNE